MTNDDLNVSAIADEVLGFAKPVKPDGPKTMEPALDKDTSSPIDDEIKLLQDKLNELIKLKSQETQEQTHKQIDVKTDNGNTNVTVNLPQNHVPNKPTNVICETCGSTDVHLISESMGICNHCGAKIIVKPSVNNASVNVNVINHTDTKTDDVGPETYVMKTNLSKDDFKRSVCIELESLRDTAPDVLSNIEFGEIQVEYSQFMVCRIHVDGTYSASIGYDRRVKYWENGKERERTVTDWEPYNGNISSDEIVAVGIKGPFEHDEELGFNALIRESNLQTDAMNYQTSGLTMELAKPTGTATQEAMSTAKSFAQGKIQYPGDRVKDKRTNCSCRIIDTQFVIAPKYVMPYRKNGENYTASSFTTQFLFMGSYPACPGIEKKREKSLQKSGFISIILSLLAVASVLIVPFLISIPLDWSEDEMHEILLGAAIGIPSMILTIAGYIIYKKVYRKKKKNLLQRFLKQKLNFIEHYLRAAGMTDLTAEERKLFEITGREELLISIS